MIFGVKAMFIFCESLCKGEIQDKRVACGLAEAMRPEGCSDATLPFIPPKKTKTKNNKRAEQDKEQTCIDLIFLLITDYSLF